MALTLGLLLQDAGIDASDALVIRHAYVREHEDTGLVGLHAESTDDEILHYTSVQSARSASFPVSPPRFWLVFIREGGSQARLWRVVENLGEVSNDGVQRVFNLAIVAAMSEMRDRLVIGWGSPRAWKVNATTAAAYPVVTIADAAPIPFPGFNRIVLDHCLLQAVLRERRYSEWSTALASVCGIYLITDTSDGRQYVGKADGVDGVRQRWSAYAANGHGGNVELTGLDASHFRYSLLRVFDPATPRHEIDAAEGHYKRALDTRRHGLNGG